MIDEGVSLGIIVPVYLLSVIIPDKSSEQTLI